MDTTTDRSSTIALPVSSDNDPAGAGAGKNGIGYDSTPVRIYWSYRSVPELRLFPEWRRKGLWDRCRRKLPFWLEAAGAGTAALAGLVGGSIGWAVAPHGLSALGLLAGVGAGLVVGAFAGEQIALRGTRFYLLAELGNHCSQCGYALDGCPSGVCPECGSPIVNAGAGEGRHSRASGSR